MAKYDFECASCDWSGERSCSIADADALHCEQCGSPLTKLFSPPSSIYVPRAFKYVFSDLFGTSSEKDFLKENPNVERVNMSTFTPARDRLRSQWAKAKQEGEDVERALNTSATVNGGRAKRIKVAVTGKPIAKKEK